MVFDVGRVVKGFRSLLDGDEMKKRLKMRKKVYKRGDR